MQSRLPLSLRVATRSQCVSARRPLACMRVRALATATADSTTSTPSSSPPPPPLSSTSTPTPSPTDPALHRLVDDISTLTLLQAADLVTLLKSRLNIQEIAFPTAGATLPAAGAGAGADDVGAGEEEVAAKPKEKTIFNVKLESFAVGAKPKVIKEVKAIVPNLTLIEAKKFVESVPKVLKEAIPKEDAEKIKKAFEAHGAIIVLE